MRFNTQKMMIIAVSFLLVFVIYKSIFTLSYSYGSNYENVTVDTRVNITNAPPEVLLIDIDEKVGSTTNITLLAARQRQVYCNVTIRDWNGYDDINKTNATFWDDNNANQDDPLNNNTVYRNTSCTNVGNDGQYLSYWECGFNLLYYANNGSNWKCNVTTVDDSIYNASNYNTTTIHPIYALNMTATQIDYGNVPVEDTSTDQTINATNVGNMNINVSVWGYGFQFNDGLAVNCSINGNITLGNERFSINPAVAWAAKTNLTNESQQVGFTVPKQTDPSVLRSNITYWQLRVPSDNNPAGICTGNVVFEATAP